MITKKKWIIQIGYCDLSFKKKYFYIEKLLKLLLLISACRTRKVNTLKFTWPFVWWNLFYCITIKLSKSILISVQFSIFSKIIRYFPRVNPVCTLIVRFGFKGILKTSFIINSLEGGPQIQNLLGDSHKKKTSWRLYFHF